jgi:hypothetical protein
MIAILISMLLADQEMDNQPINDNNNNQPDLTALLSMMSHDASNPNQQNGQAINEINGDFVQLGNLLGQLEKPHLEKIAEKNYGSNFENIWGSGAVQGSSKITENTELQSKNLFQY